VAIPSDRYDAAKDIRVWQPTHRPQASEVTAVSRLQHPRIACTYQPMDHEHAYIGREYDDVARP
jgi:hypothetical protein